MRIIVDAMGGDNAPYEIVNGAIAAAKEFDVEVVLVGRAEEVLKAVQDSGYDSIPKGVEIANAEDVVTMEDDPARAVLQKKNSSMSVGLRMLKSGEGDAMISAGSTGALLSGATLVVGRIKGIRRAAMAPMIPTSTGKMLLIDCGANVDCPSEYMVQFAYMGSYYMKLLGGVENPRVGLLNIGAEDTKGNQQSKETYALLKAEGETGRLNFIGNMEATSAFHGDVDVLVSDGFAGNVLLKTTEGVGSLLVGKLKGVFGKNFKSKMAYLLVKNEMTEFKKGIDYNEVGGTALLGISAPVIKAHGSAKSKAIQSAVRQAIEFKKADVIGAITENIDYMKISKEGK